MKTACEKVLNIDLETYIDFNYERMLTTNNFINKNIKFEYNERKKHFEMKLEQKCS